MPAGSRVGLYSGGGEGWAKEATICSFVCSIGTVEKRINSKFVPRLNFTMIVRLLLISAVHTIFIQCCLITNQKDIALILLPSNIFF